MGAYIATKIVTTYAPPAVVLATRALFPFSSLAFGEGTSQLEIRRGT
jgi:hypothetical protein